MSSEPSFTIRSSRPIRRLLSQRVSLAEDASMVLSRVAMRYEEICEACVPPELTDQHWAMIFEALAGVAPTDQANLLPGRAALRDHVELYATLPPPSPVAVHLAECMDRWTVAQWVAVLDRAERHSWLDPVDVQSST